jgi:hypothetical protein
MGARVKALASVGRNSGARAQSNHTRCSNVETLTVLNLVSK